MSSNVAEEWARFATLVLPPGAPQVQRTETRRAFYAGVGSCFALVNEISDRPEVEAMALMDSLNSELLRYRDDLRDGRA